jgi:signal transduction histidine kinase
VWQEAGDFCIYVFNRIAFQVKMGYTILWFMGEDVLGETMMDNMTKYDYSRQILTIRNQGKMNGAICIALEARERYPDENIFEKILGDMYFQIYDYDAAGDAYIGFLKKIGDNIQYIKHFAKFMQRYSNVVRDLNGYILRVEACLDQKTMSEEGVASVCEIISHYVNCPKIEWFESDRNFDMAVKYIHEIEGSCQLYVLYYNVLELKHSNKNKRIDKYVVSSMEKKKRYQEALRLIVEVLGYDQDQVAVRTLFRICRKLGDYSEAEKYILNHPRVKEEKQFNILYELVFYYSNVGNVKERDLALKKIELCGRDSMPIMRTLYNFYLQFGMLEKAAEMNAKVMRVRLSKREEDEDRKQQENDAIEALLKTVQEMFMELEHSRKLISMSELLKGFSHELGQPITNIRYSVQLFQMKMERGVHTEEELEKLLRDILFQTYRIKRLLARFSPIASEKNSPEKFGIVAEIKAVFDEFSTRLSGAGIEWGLEAKEDFYLLGDNVKFNQIFYNLIGNSIYAIKEKGGKGHIGVMVQEKKQEIVITFEDNGVGIEPEYKERVFEPFFTTKEGSGEEEGEGQGLGLYIIWNIVRMFDGTISIDKDYQNGARFIIRIKKKAEREHHE